MKRHTYGWLLAMGLVVPMTAWASGRTSLGLTVNIGNAPPPPVVVREEPRCVVVPGSTVYMVENPAPYDMFRYGVFWYVYNDGYWYRARGYRGPFAAIEVRYVPRAIMTVPERHWRHHPHGGPPGLTRRERDRDEVVVVKSEGRRRGRGHDRD
jgi:hypothetical protein